MTRFVGYKNDSLSQDLIYESMDDGNWAHTMNSYITPDGDSEMAFMLIDFDRETATITGATNGLSGTIAIEFFPTLAVYMAQVIEQMDAELTALITGHGVTESRGL